MTNRINIYLISIFTALSAIVAIFMSGKRTGKQQTEAKQNEQTLDNVAQAANAHNDAVRSLNDDVKRQQLRSRWTRKSK